MTPVRNICFLEFISFLTTKNLLLGWISSHRANPLAPADRVLQKYGKQNLSVTGHSQGGGISYHIATKYDLEGHHYNPAINQSNIVQAGKFANNKNAQNIYKTHLDFASPLAYSKNLKKSKTTVHTVGTIEGMDNPVSTHSVDQFSPTPSIVHADDTVSVKRKTAKQSIKNGIKHTVTYHPVGPN